MVERWFVSERIGKEIDRVIAKKHSCNMPFWEVKCQTLFVEWKKALIQDMSSWQACKRKGSQLGYSGQ